MIISNSSRRTTVATQASEAHSFTQKLFGLMGKADMPEDAGLIIYHTNWIHTFWMRFPLDLIYLDGNAVVVGLEADLAPNRIGKPFWRAQTVVELCSGAIKSSRTELGDRLLIAAKA